MLSKRKWMFHACINVDWPHEFCILNRTDKQQTLTEWENEVHETKQSASKNQKLDTHKRSICIVSSVFSLHKRKIIPTLTVYVQCSSFYCAIYIFVPEYFPFIRLYKSVWQDCKSYSKYLHYVVHREHKCWNEMLIYWRVDIFQHPAIFVQDF